MEIKQPFISLVMIYRRPDERFVAAVHSAINAGVEELVLVNTGPDEKPPGGFQLDGIPDGVKVIRRDYRCPDDFELDGKGYIGDFAAARNVAHSLATGEWHLTLDADDELEPGCYNSRSLPVLLREWIEKNPGMRAASMRYEYSRLGTKVAIEHRRIRLLKADKSWTFRGQLHEEIIADGNFFHDVYDVGPGEYTVIHHGDEAGSERRNTALLERLIAKRGVERCLPQIQLAWASVLGQREEFVEAALIAERIAEEHSAEERGYQAAIVAASAWRNAGDWTRAAENLGTAIAIQPGNREAYIYLALLKRDSNDLPGAAEAFREAFIRTGESKSWGLQYPVFIEEARKVAVKTLIEVGDTENARMLLSPVGNSVSYRALLQKENEGAAAVHAKELYYYLCRHGYESLADDMRATLPEQLVWTETTDAPPRAVLGSRAVDDVVCEALSGDVAYATHAFTALETEFIEKADDDEDSPIDSLNIWRTGYPAPTELSFYEAGTLIIEGPCFFDKQFQREFLNCRAWRVLVIVPASMDVHDFTPLQYSPVRAVHHGEDSLLELMRVPPRSQVKFLDILAPGPVEWGPQTHYQKGVGGSEQAVIHLAPLLSRHFDVDVWASPLDRPTVERGVRWHDADAFDPTARDTPILVWRAAAHLPKLREMNPKRRLVYWAHDVPHAREKNDLLHADVIIALSQYHKRLFLELDVPEENITVLRNGIDKETIERIQVDERERDSKACIYASSGVRGLLWLLAMWQFVRRRVPNATLHVCTDLTMLTRLTAPGRARRLGRTLLTMLEELKNTGVVFHGSLPHGQLLELEARCSIWANPSPFYEISCITAMETQAMGCWPVSSDTGALAETCLEGPLVSQAALLEESGFTAAQRRMLDRSGELWELPRQRGRYQRALQESFRELLIHTLQNPPRVSDRAKLSRLALARYDWASVAGDFAAALDS